MVSVSLILRTGRTYFEARWIDPVSGRKRTRSTGCRVRREAERFAARLEQEIEADNGNAPERMPWKDLQERYSAEVAPFLSDATVKKTNTMFGVLQELIDPKYAASITTAVVARFKNELMKRELSPYSVRGYLSELRKILRWAHRQRLIKAVPQIEMPRCIETMKGRPITLEEFERMLQAVPKALTQQVDDEAKAIPPDDKTVAAWGFLLRGLWLSGLRLQEALRLHWSDDRELCVDLSGEYPFLKIQAHAQKSRRAELLPIMPDFAEFLMAVPKHERKGYVFRPVGMRHETRPNFDWVSKVISKMGKIAKIKVSPTKFASAHDLRRSFGFRWAEQLLPQQLQQLMRHKDIKTTQLFYVGKNAHATAAAIWTRTKGVGNSLGNSQHLEAAKTQERVS